LPNSYYLASLVEILSAIFVCRVTTDRQNLTDGTKRPIRCLTTVGTGNHYSQHINVSTTWTVLVSLSLLHVH